LLSTDDKVALPDCEVTFYYSNYDAYEITNSEGEATQLSRTITNTAPIWVIAEKDSFFPDTSFIYPYMWSTISEATGKNNGNHIIRRSYIDDFTDNVYITYSDGTRTIYGYKDLYNNSFELEAAGLGTDGALERNVNRNMSLIMWDKGSTYYSAEFASPIQDYDSLSLPAIDLYAPSLKYNSVDFMMNFAGLSYRYINDESGDLLYAKFSGTLSSTPTTLIPYTGEQDQYYNLIQVKNNQSISLYEQNVSGTVMLSPIIAYISANNECAVKYFDANYMYWNRSLVVSQPNNLSSNSTIWKDGAITRVVWENVGADGKQYILQKEITETSFADTLIDTIEDNAYDVKVKDYRLFAYVKENSICMKQYADRIPNGFERVIVEGTDSVFAPDIDIKYTLNPYRPTYSTIYAIWTEKKGDEYRIGYREDSIMNLELSPLYASELATTEITMTESSIYDYVTGKFPVEKMKYDIAGLQQDHYYEVSIITSDKNPYIPQIVKIDGEVIGVVYGGKGEDTTKVMVPKEYYEDGYLSIELERKVGKDARVARVECYEYDEVDSETLTQLGKGNRIKLNEEQTDAKINNIVENGLIAYEVTETGAGEIEVIDITGRVIKQSKVNSVKGINTFSVKELPAGIYFIRTDNTTNKLRKIIKLK
ncbi:MAG: T9SS type A sorting domain-containing protein, partial [bacterium]|nr:T9SS type A sorting domain-containing protein [bacterium]